MKIIRLTVCIGLLASVLFAKEVQSGFVKKILHGGSYTYLQIEDKKSNYWVAVTRKEAVEIGDEVRFDVEMEVKKLQSKALQREFANIIFASNLMYRR